MKKSKTVLFKIWKFPELSETFILNQVVTSLNLGYKVKILVGELKEFSNANLDLLNKYNIRDKIIIEDYNIPEKRFTRYFKALSLLIRSALFWTQLIKYFKYSGKKSILPLFEFFFYINYRNIDVIHIQFGTNKHPIDLLKKAGLINSKLVVSFHGHDLQFPINKLIPNNGYYEILFREAEILVANTRFLQKILLDLNAPKDRISVIPVTVNTELFKPSVDMIKNSRVKLITVGRLCDWKGQKYGVLALKCLIERGYDLEYEIIGSGPSYQSLIELIQELDLQDRVSLRGAVSNKDLPSILVGSDIFLMTSITTLNGIETQGLVTGEAQACSLPIVAFDSGGVKYTVVEGETGFLCKEKDVNCMADKIELLIINNSFREEMGKKGRKFVEKEFSEVAVRNKWRDIYG